MIEMVSLLMQGHSVTRKLNSDGKVDTLQTLHNLNEGLFLLSVMSAYRHIVFYAILQPKD